MNQIDWKRLASLREHQRKMAVDALSRDRKDADQSRALWRQAEDLHQQELSSKADHWHALRDFMAGGACDVARLRQAGDWSGALDAKIAQAKLLSSQAEDVLGNKEAMLARSREALTRANGEVEKALRMRAKNHALQQRLQNAREEESVDESAAQRWSAQQAERS